jgi:type II secretory pathway pseudopilin PulG
MPDRPEPETIKDALARLAAAGERLAGLPSPMEIRRRARRRRRVRVAGAAFGLALLAMLALQGRALLDHDQAPLLPTAPQPSATTLPIPTTTRSTVTTTTRSAATTTGPSSRNDARPTTIPAAGVARVSVVPNPARPGQQVTIVGSGCKAGELVGLSWRPYPKTASVANLPSTMARADGTFRTTWAIPTLMRPGTIAIDAYCGQHGPGSETVLTVASTTTT